MALARVPNVSNKNAYTAREPKVKQSLVPYSLQFLVFEASKARDVAHWDSLDGGLGSHQHEENSHVY